MDLNQNYKIIYDPEQVQTFLKLFSPKCSQDVLEFLLFARRKYCPSLSKGEIILSRTFIDNNDSTSELRSLRKLYRLHVPIGSFVHGPKEESIPQESLALYASLIHKCPIKAMTKTLTKCLDDIITGNNNYRCHKLFKAEISRSNSTSSIQYDVIDLDSKESDKVQSVIELIKESNLTSFIKICIETKNGYHIAFEKNKEINRKLLYEFKTKTIFYKENNKGQSVKDYWFSITNTPIVIVPGTLQGGFKTKICNELFL